ncbi:hypothetical protein [Muricoccus radiodurans]|uniref:hypothetical protein n=1 Tax=Muricoccus radiodurans TaxID=2231721 RepID=UPI003CEF62EC
MSDEPTHWAQDPYWTEALAAFGRRRRRGLRFVTLDFDALERTIVNGDGTAYRLMDAMVTVRRDEGLEGCKGAPRLLLAALMRLAEVSGTTGRILSAARAEGRDGEQ